MKNWLNGIALALSTLLPSYSAPITWDLEGTFSGDQSRLSGDGSTLLYGHVSVTSPSVGDVFNVVRTSDLSAIGSQITPGPVSTYHPAISHDGTVVAFADAGTNVVEVYQYSGGAWSRKGSDIIGSGYFGWSMDISGDGDTLIVGDRTGGYASVYEFDSGSWSQVGSNITGGGIGSERFGADVAISYDGSVVAIGGNQGGSNKNGVVRVYENDSGTWNQVGSDVYGSTDSRLGFSLGLSADGNTFASGAIRGNSGGSESGEVKVYELVSGSWVQVGSDISGDSAGDNFGHGTSISPDGNYIVSTSYDGGYAKVYQNVANSWTQLGSNLTGSDWTGASYADISNGGSYVSLWYETSGDSYISLFSNSSNAVPETGTTILLLGSSLVLLTGVRRKFMKK